MFPILLGLFTHLLFADYDVWLSSERGSTRLTVKQKKIGLCNNIRNAQISNIGQKKSTLPDKNNPLTPKRSYHIQHLDEQVTILKVLFNDHQPTT